MLEMGEIRYYIMNLEDMREDISTRIKRLRKAAGYSSAAAFAKEIGLPTAKYTHYEQSNTSMPLEVAKIIASGLSVSLDELAYGKSEQKPEEDLTKRIAKLDAQGKRELEEMLEFVEFKYNRRRLEKEAARKEGEVHEVEIKFDE